MGEPGATRHHSLQAGAAAVEVTPDPGCWLAGFGRNRRAGSVADPLWARALALRCGRQTVALVSVDCLGLLRVDADQVASRVGLRPGHLLVCATHTHSGPDTLGLWGPDGATSGVAAEVMATLLDGAAAAVKLALGALQPALLTLARISQPPRTAVNVRDPESLDPDVAALHVATVGGRGVATLINWGCHPEVLTNRSTVISSDFAHALRLRVEETFGGPAIFVNGALGAMVTPAAASESLGEAARIGQAVADEAVAALLAAEEIVDHADLAVATREVTLPLVSPQLRAAVAQGLLRGGFDSSEEHLTRVSAWGLGPATFLAIPGEPQPALVRRWKRMMGRRHRFVISLAGDEIGYLLRRDDFELERYAYERTMSLGPDTAPRLNAAVQSALAAVEG
ncbi:MAG: hypothetical protein IT204_04280 [Fimbriimonadaceae bacterium]|nr:hypothetical protein [Fimbriimonadaceae bacterium]